MKKLFSLYLAMLLTINLAYSQYVFNEINIVSLNTVKTEYSKVDFFKDQKKLFCWSGPISTLKTQRGIASLPLMEFNDLSIGQCRIISYPKAGLSAWEAIIKPIHDLEGQHREVRKIALDPKVQQNYDIYAFFVEAKNLIPFQDMGNPNAREPKFPCTVFVYKKDAAKWALLKKINVNNFTDLSDLEFSSVTAGRN